jgi:hypothetical protein
VTASNPNADESEHVDADAFLPVPQGLFCPECDYDLRGLTSARCPECGFELQALRSLESQIPWAHRRKLGRFRAYWKTVWLVTFRHKRFCREIARPISYADSQRFRWVTGVVAYCSFLLASLAWAVLDWPTFADAVGEFGVWYGVLVHACVLLFWVTATGAPSCLLHPRRLSIERQNRAIAMSHYACASLACMPAAWLVAVALARVAFWRPGVLELLVIPLVTVWLTFAIGWWLGLVYLARAVWRDAAHTARVSLMVPPLLFACALFFLFVIPAAVFYVTVIIDSLR